MEVNSGNRVKERHVFVFQNCVKGAYIQFK